MAPEEIRNESEEQEQKHRDRQQQPQGRHLSDRSSHRFSKQNEWVHADDRESDHRRELGGEGRVSQVVVHELGRHEGPDGGHLHGKMHEAWPDEQEQRNPADGNIASSRVTEKDPERSDGLDDEVDQTDDRQDAADHRILDAPDRAQRRDLLLGLLQSEAADGAEHLVNQDGHQRAGDEQQNKKARKAPGQQPEGDELQDESCGANQEVDEQFPLAAPKIAEQTDHQLLAEPQGGPNDDQKSQRGEDPHVGPPESCEPD